MILFLQVATEKVKKVTEGLNNSEETVNNPSVFQDIISLLDVIIWPLAMIATFYMFRDHIGRIIKSLGSIKATTNGFEINFIDAKLDQAAKFIGIGPSDKISPKGVDKIHPRDDNKIIPKAGGRIIPKNNGGVVPESGTVVTPKRTHADSPYQELIELQDTIKLRLTNIATQNGVSSNTSSNFALTNELADRDFINSHTAQKLKMLIELNTIGLNSPQTTHNQVSQMKKLYNNITF